MLMLRRNSNDVFYSKNPTTEPKRSHSEKKHNTIKVRHRYEIGNEPADDVKRDAKNLGDSLKSTSLEETPVHKKKQHESSHLWKPDDVDSTNISKSLDETKSYGSYAKQDVSALHGGCIEDPRFELEISCGHCSLVAEYRRQLLKSEMESAVTLLARRLGSVKNVPRKIMPNIIVSISSDEEELISGRRINSEHESSMQNSESSTASSSALPSPPFEQSDDYIELFESSESSQNPITSQLLMPYSLLTPYTDSTSPSRSNSIDLSLLRRDNRLNTISSEDSSVESEIELTTPIDSFVKTIRSQSFDPATAFILRRPSRIEHLTELFRKALAKSPVVKRSAVEQEARILNKHRTSGYWFDEQIHPAEHIWLPSSRPGSSTSVDSECYVGEKDCRKMGEKRRCAACHIVAHTSCFSLLAKLNLNCKVTFHDHTMRKQPSKEMIDSLSMHHWIHKWRHEGRCSKCGKSFQQKMFNFQQKEKETTAVVCSWCKESYHLKNCFDREQLEERCNRGQLKEVIVPPNWIFRLPFRHRNKHKQPMNRKSRKATRQFVVKPNDWSVGPSQPVLVFVNPKSGGNKGSKALHTLCWLLNPRQVFDITSLKGPKYGLEVYRKVVNQLKILVCGGDGTVGWVLQTLDNLNWATYPPMAIVPLGTGNDLSRCMGWGGVLSDEPISQLLQAVHRQTTVTYLDRWKICVEANDSSPLEAGDELNDVVQSSLPLTVMNNYFSIGADAHVALQFHHSRSANPQMLNSRLKNRIAYGGLGTIDLFKRAWKDLSDYIYLECDGIDITPRIKELKLHCILFHNITYYAGGTVPWGSESTGDGTKPSCCDGKIEVLGFTTATLAALQMGGKGERLAQCSEVKVTTYKAIPMQVDGEPCLLAASHIRLTFHSKVQSTSVILQVSVNVVGRRDYDTYKDTFEQLRDTGFEIGVINVESECDLDVARVLIQKLLDNHPCLPYQPSNEWRFLDYVTNAEEGTFRIPRAQEHVHSVSDISDPEDCLLILDHGFPSITSKSNASSSDLICNLQIDDPQTQHSFIMQRNDMETLRIVLNSDAQETHL